MLPLHFLGSVLDDFLEQLELLHVGDQRHHDLGDGGPTRRPALTRLGRGLEDRASLHLADLGVGHRQAAAAMSKHGVGLAELGGPAPHALQRHMRSLCHRRHLCLGVRNELVQGRVEQAHRHGQPVHDGEELHHVRALHDQELVQGCPAAGLIQSQYHLAHRHDAVALEKHVLSAHEPDAFCTEISGGPGVCRSLGVGANLHTSEAIRPLHDRAEVATQLRGHRGDLTKHHLPRSAIDREHVSRSHHELSDMQVLRGIVHSNCTSSGDARTSHATCHHSSMARHASTRSQDALGRVNAPNVFRTGLDADKQHALPGRAESFGFIGRKDHFAAGCARRGREPLGHNVPGSIGVQSRMQNLVQTLRLQAHDGLRVTDETRTCQVHGDLECSLRGAFASPRLQHVQLAPLDGELNILHVLEMLLELLPHVQELLVDRWHSLLEREEL
mmetsp:Transcript_48308/g.155723  ORF Transcript_48308/g.155723 Transcript_48308/m.155723 type:complete len:444 (-) Transcript_48308:185-1516(-)